MTKKIEFYVVSCQLCNVPDELKLLVSEKSTSFGPIIEWDDRAWSFYCVEGNTDSDEKFDGICTFKQYDIQRGLSFSQNYTDRAIENCFNQIKNGFCKNIVIDPLSIDEIIEKSWCYGTFDINFFDNQKFVEDLKASNTILSDGFFTMKNGVPDGAYRVKSYDNKNNVYLKKYGIYNNGELVLLKYRYQKDEEKTYNINRK